jgi:hypothetical protein
MRLWRAHRRKGRALRVGVRLRTALRVRMRLGRARGRKGKALRVGVRLRRAYERNMAILDKETVL